MRLRPLTVDRPKALIEVDGAPIVIHQLNWLHGAVNKVTFACGYKADILMSTLGNSYKGISLSYSIEETHLGTGGAIKKALNDIDDETVLVLNGDVLTDFQLKYMIKEHDAHTPITTMLLIPFRSPFGVIKIDKLKTVREFVEKPELPDIWVNGGVYIMQTKKIMPYLPESGDIEKAVFPRLASYGELLAFPYYGKWRSIDSFKDVT